MKALNLIGQTFGRLTVTARANNTPGGQTRWVCKCQCGTDTIVQVSALRTPGHTQSCGCKKREQTIARSTNHGHSTGSRITPTYHSWNGMVARCTNPNNISFPAYGGRGIRVCDAWLDFRRFLADMGEKPKECSIDRIDTNGHYEPSNCRWATPTTQSRNKRNNRCITFNGETLFLAEWAERLNIKASVISERLIAGWSTEDALTLPPIGYRRILTFNDETRSVAQWARYLGIPSQRIYQRLHRGDSIEKALKP